MKNNANTIFENFLREIATASSMEEKEYAMIEAYDALDEAGYSEFEKNYIWNQMLMKA